MRKIILYIASSLNGYIARKDGSVDWLDNIPNPDNDDYGFNDLNQSIDTTIQGNSSYKQIVDWGIEFPYKKTTNYVLTNNESLKDNENVKFISKDHIEFIRNLKSQKGKDIWLIGGGKVNSMLLENNFIDELYLFLIPIILYDGIALFEKLDYEKSLSIIDTNIYKSGIVRYRYRIGN